MKKMFFILFVFFIGVDANAQLQNSKWKATLQLNEPVDVVFSFSNDTLYVTSSENNESLETMAYAFKDTVLTMHKLSGQSECATDAIATYSCKISGNEMQLGLIADDCYDRSGVIKDLKLSKVQ